MSGARTSRGGRDQFSWTDVAADKDRENYLGHSVLAPVGRWQMGRDLTWYAKQKAPAGAAGIAGAAAQQSALELERAAIKAEEEERRLEALGIRKRVPKPPPAPEAFDPREAAQLFARTKTEPTDGDAAGASSSDADRVSGLGFRADGVQPAGGSGSMQLEAGGSLEGSMGGGAAAAAAAGGAALAASSSGGAPDLDAVALSEEALLADPSLDAASRAILLEAAAIRAKEAKKRHKKEKKEKEKKSKKDRKKDKEKDRGRDTGSSSSSSHKRRSRSPSSPRSRSRSPAARDRDRRRDRRDSRSRSRSRSRDKQRRERDDRR